MTARENLSIIYRKTYIALFFIFGVAFSIYIFLTFFELSKIIVRPFYDGAFEFKEGFIYEPFVKNYITTKIFLLFLKNLFFNVSLFSILCFSFFISERELISSDGLKNSFSQIVSRALYIVLFFVFFHYVSLDYLITKFDRKSESIKGDSFIALNLLKEGNIAFINGNYKEALYYYTNYINVVGKDDTIKIRLREISNALKISTFEEKKSQTKEKIKIAEKNVPTNLVKHEDLAKFYYDNKDYVTALYYYKIMLETGGSAKVEAEKRIKDIKRFLNYQESKGVTNITEREAEEILKKVYILKAEADELLSQKEYQKAYFIYNDILLLNPNLRDVVEKKNMVLSVLRDIAGEIGELELASLYPKKSNILFMKKSNQVVYIESAVKSNDSYYLFNVKQYQIDSNFKINNLIESKYAVIRAKDKKRVLLYVFSKNDRNIEYFPFITENQKRVKYSENYIDLPMSFDLLYDFSYDYQKSIHLPLVKLLELKKIAYDKTLSYSGLNKQLIDVAILDKINRVFLFLVISFIGISIGWRLRSRYIEKFPKVLYFAMLIIPFFVYYVINLIVSSSSVFISVLLLVLSFNTVFILVLVVDFLFLLLSIFLLSTNKS